MEIQDLRKIHLHYYRELWFTVRSKSLPQSYLLPCFELFDHLLIRLTAYITLSEYIHVLFFFNDWTVKEQWCFFQVDTLVTPIRCYHKTKKSYTTLSEHLCFVSTNSKRKGNIVERVRKRGDEGVRLIYASFISVYIGNKKLELVECTPMTFCFVVIFSFRFFFSLLLFYLWIALNANRVFPLVPTSHIACANLMTGSSTYRLVIYPTIRFALAYSFVSLTLSNRNIMHMWLLIHTQVNHSHSSVCARILFFYRDMSLYVSMYARENINNLMTYHLRKLVGSKQQKKNVSQLIQQGACIFLCRPLV